MWRHFCLLSPDLRGSHHTAIVNIHGLLWMIYSTLNRSNYHVMLKIDAQTYTPVRTHTHTHTHTHTYTLTHTHTHTHKHTHERILLVFVLLLSLSVCLSVYLVLMYFNIVSCFCLPLSLSICMPLCLSVCLSLSLSVDGGSVNVYLCVREMLMCIDM